MTEQVIFKIDKSLKEQAMRRAKNEGLAFSAVLKLATQAYAKGYLDVEIVPQPRFNTKTRRIIDKALKDIEKRQNLSPKFNNAKKAISYLENL